MGAHGGRPRTNQYDYAQCDGNSWRVSSCTSYSSNGHYTSTGKFFTTEYTNGILSTSGADASVYTYGAGNCSLRVCRLRTTPVGTAGQVQRNRTSGDLAVIGSHDVSARTVGVAGGLDYRLTPDTVVGFASAGGGTDWSLRWRRTVRDLRYRRPERRACRPSSSSRPQSCLGKRHLRRHGDACMGGSPARTSAFFRLAV